MQQVSRDYRMWQEMTTEDTSGELGRCPDVRIRKTPRESKSWIQCRAKLMPKRFKGASAKMRSEDVRHEDRQSVKQGAYTGEDVRRT